MSDDERKIYTLVARQYLMQFCPDAMYRKCVIDLDIANGKFVAKARFLAEAGWRALLGAKERDDEDEGSPLPVVAKGDELLCEKGELMERQTQPPRPFTDATLLSAMTGIARFVQDKELKKILRATDGLGTEATRAGIIELLFRRTFLYKKGRYIHSSEAGRALIHCLPEIAARPDMTADWEATLTQISEKRDAIRISCSLWSVLCISLSSRRVVIEIRRRSVVCHPQRKRAPRENISLKQRRIRHEQEFDRILGIASGAAQRLSVGKS